MQKKINLFGIWNTFKQFWGYVIYIPNPNQSHVDFIIFCLKEIHLLGI